MAKRSAGILPYRRSTNELQVLLVHPGGPFWRSRDVGASWGFQRASMVMTNRRKLRRVANLWRKPAGSSRERCFRWERCASAAASLLRPSASKAISMPAPCAATSFEMEWPPRSGRMQTFPEIDRAGWFGLEMAREKLLSASGLFSTGLQCQSKCGDSIAD